MDYTMLQCQVSGFTLSSVSEEEKKVHEGIFHGIRTRDFPATSDDVVDDGDDWVIATM